MMIGVFIVLEALYRSIGMVWSIGIMIGTALYQCTGHRWRIGYYGV